jgi:hypothetical protein
MRQPDGTLQARTDHTIGGVNGIFFISGRIPCDITRGH